MIPQRRYKREALNLLFYEAVQIDPDGRIRTGTAGIQMALDPGNTAGVRMEVGGYELLWVGKSGPYHLGFSDQGNAFEYHDDFSTVQLSETIG